MPSPPPRAVGIAGTLVLVLGIVTAVAQSGSSDEPSTVMPSSSAQGQDSRGGDDERAAAERAAAERAAAERAAAERAAAEAQAVRQWTARVDVAATTMRIALQPLSTAFAVYGPDPDNAVLNDVLSRGSARDRVQASLEQLRSIPPPASRATVQRQLVVRADALDTAVRDLALASDDVLAARASQFTGAVNAWRATLAFVYGRTPAAPGPQGPRVAPNSSDAAYLLTVGEICRSQGPGILQSLEAFEVDPQTLVELEVYLANLESVSSRFLEFADRVVAVPVPQPGDQFEPLRENLTGSRPLFLEVIAASQAITSIGVGNATETDGLRLERAGQALVDYSLEEAQSFPRSGGSRACAEFTA